MVPLAGLLVLSLSFGLEEDKQKHVEYGEVLATTFGGKLTLRF